LWVLNGLEQSQQDVTRQAGARLGLIHYRLAATREQQRRQGNEGHKVNEGEAVSCWR
jgi:hypothetical protein